MSIAYHIYGNTGAGDPIDYSSPLATSSDLNWTAGPLSFPGIWSLTVRAFDSVSGLEEQNVDCTISIILDSNGNDITYSPQVRRRQFAHSRSRQARSASSGIIRRRPDSRPQQALMSTPVRAALLAMRRPLRPSHSPLASPIHLRRPSPDSRTARLTRSACEPTTPLPRNQTRTPST